MSEISEAQTRETPAKVDESQSLGLLGEVDEDEFSSEENVSDVYTEIETSKNSYAWSYQNGRRYASSELGNYFLPNDAPEIKRLNEQHRTYTDIKDGKLHFAPLAKKDGSRILDVGCGSGIWCIEMAELYPKASVFGLDISPIQPEAKPANVSWDIGDMETDWPYPENYFDLIHLRLVHGSVKDWSAFLAKIKRHLIPGGWIEQHELSLATQYLMDEHGRKIPESDELDQMTPYIRWTKLMKHAAEKRGRPIQLGPEIGPMQREAGFEDVTVKVFPHKWGGWPSDPKERELGIQTMEQTSAGMEGFTTVLFTKSLGWSLKDTRNFIDQVQQDMRDDGLRKVMDLHVVYGQKPVGPLRRRDVKEPNKGGSSDSTALVQSPGLQLNSLVVATIAASFVAALVHWVYYGKK